MKHTIRIVLKSGYSFAFQCENMKITTIGNEITAYSFDGAKSTHPMYIKINDISAVIEECEEGE